MFQLRAKPPYSQEEIAEQIGQIADLMRMRKAASELEEIERFNDNIEMAQHVLSFMLEENTHHGTTRRKTSTL